MNDLDPISWSTCMHASAHWTSRVAICTILIEKAGQTVHQHLVKCLSQSSPLSRLGANHAGCIERSSVRRQHGECKCRDGKSCLVWVWHRFLVARKLHPFEYPCRNSRLLVDDMTRGVGRTLDLYGKFSLYHADKMYCSSSNKFCISHQLNMCRAERFQRRSSKRPWGLPLWPRSQRVTFSSRYCTRWVQRTCPVLRLILWGVVWSVALAGGQCMRSTSRFVSVLSFLPTRSWIWARYNLAAFCCTLSCKEEWVTVFFIIRNCSAKLSKS